jgi:hypothetical protein
MTTIITSPHTSESSVVAKGAVGFIHEASLFLNQLPHLI